MDYKKEAAASRKAKLKSMTDDGGSTPCRAGGGSTKGWGSWEGPMPINKDGADYAVRTGSATGPGNFGKTSGKFDMDANDFKARRRAEGGKVNWDYYDNPADARASGKRVLKNIREHMGPDGYQRMIESDKNEAQEIQSKFRNQKVEE